MPLAINLPTTSALDFNAFYRTSNDEARDAIRSLQDTRAQLRSRLKAHKRASDLHKGLQSQEILSLVETYCRWLYRLRELLETQSIEATKELTTEWTSIPNLLSQTMTSTAHMGKCTVTGLSSEISQTIFVYGLVYYCIGASFSDPPDNAPLLKKHTTDLTTSASIFSHLSSPAAKAFAELAHAEATLLAVLPMDPYPSYLSVTSTGGIIRISANDQSGKEWLYTPPPKPKGVKALLISRLCIAASDHSVRAGAYIQDDKGMAKLKKYSDKLAREAKAKACRFLGIDAESSGRAGEGIGWIKAGRVVLKGLECDEDDVLKELEVRWTSANDKYGFEKLVSEKDLLSKIPSGRDLFEIKTWEGFSEKTTTSAPSRDGYY